MAAGLTTSIICAKELKDLLAHIKKVRLEKLLLNMICLSGIVLKI